MKIIKLKQKSDIIDQSLIPFCNTLFQQFKSTEYITGYNCHHKHKALLIVLSALRRFQFENISKLIFYRDNVHYTNQTQRYGNRFWYTFNNVIPIIKTLEEQKYIKIYDKEFFPKTKKSRPSYILPTKQLLDIFEYLPKPDIITSNHEVIRLSGPKNRYGYRDLIDYQETADTIYQRKRIQEINKFLQNQISPDIFLYRQFIFNKFEPTSFNLGGRLYQFYPKDFWLNNKTDRIYLSKFFGENVIQLDFDGMYINLLYNIELKHKYDFEPYVFPKKDFPIERQYVKDIFLPAINTNQPDITKTREASVKAILKKRHGHNSIKKKTKFIADEEQKYKDSFDLFFHVHSSLIPFVGQRLGVKYQYYDSCIMMNILENLIIYNIPALPVHDAILIAESKADIAKDIMHQEYKKFTGFNITISKDIISTEFQ